MSKTILITGATGNLGEAVSALLITEGHTVIGTYVPGHNHPENEVDYYPCDLISAEDTNQLFETLQEKYKSIDAVILLVGGFAMGNISSSKASDLEKMIQLNLFTAYNTSSAGISWMKKGNGGKLVFVGAKPAIEGGASAVLPYALSKNAVIKLAEIINEDDTLENITASVIVPSIIDTPVNRDAMPDANFNDWVTPKEIAENISYLISEKANPLRGTILKLYKNA